MTNARIWMQINQLAESKLNDDSCEDDPIYDTLFPTQINSLTDFVDETFDTFSTNNKDSLVTSRRLTVVRGLASPAGADQIPTNIVSIERETKAENIVNSEITENTVNNALTKAKGIHLPNQGDSKNANNSSATAKSVKPEPIESLLPNIYQQSVTPVKENEELYGYYYYSGEKSEKQDINYSDVDYSDVVVGWDVAPSDEGAPPSYSPLKRSTNKSLKQNQVDLLKKEMDHQGGVKVILRRADCHHTIAFIDLIGKVWIGGWNQTARPFLHNAFHVGDEIISINQHIIENSANAYKLIKFTAKDENVIFIIKRVPFAKVFSFRREHNDQHLGIQRQDKTGEICNVMPFSIAHNQGLPSKSPTIDGRNLCNWYITEINNRPVSLFFKRTEIEHRLNAVGLDISILVQPSDFVNEIKKNLKHLKDYKDYIPK